MTKALAVKKVTKIPSKVELSDKEKYEMAFDIGQKELGKLGEKKGFEAYQYIRDFLIGMFLEPEKAKLFLTDQSHYRGISDFQLFDQAYIDNFTLCLTIKIKSPEVYEEMVKIIDKHVKPKNKKEEGLVYLYQECGAFLTLLLQNYSISARQALRVAAQLVNFSESTIEKSYRKRMVGLDKQLTNELPPPLILALLYLALHIKNVNPDTIRPFQKNARSQKEIEKAVKAYWHFTENVIRHHQENILQYLQEHSLKIIPAAAKEFGINFPLSEKEVQKANHLSALFITVTALMIELMPQVIFNLEKTYMQET